MNYCYLSGTESYQTVQKQKSKTVLVYDSSLISLHIFLGIWLQSFYKCHVELVILGSECMNLKSVEGVQQPCFCEKTQARFKESKMSLNEVF